MCSDSHMAASKNMALEDRYERLIQYLTDYIYTVTIRDRVAAETYHGPGCVSITGYTLEDYRSDPDLWSKMVPRTDRERVLEQARRALAGEEVPPLEHRIIHRDGTTRWIRNTIVPTRSPRPTNASRIMSVPSCSHRTSSQENSFSRTRSWRRRRRTTRDNNE